AKEIVWCQEEPRNMGSWSYILEPLEKTLAECAPQAGRPGYVGRAASASPATGSMKIHTKEQAALVDEALSIAPAMNKATKKAPKKTKTGKNKR
ncbi:MAG: hypothetical protein HQ512_01300, partial [Rhodospirillales bacterium]|nr:hypothetical protein [Rhodospirillales bacterium]